VMDQSYLLELSRDGLQVALMVSLPILGVTLFVGLLVSVFQAVTQVQEMTLTYVPKILAAVAVIVIFGSWMLSTLVSYTKTCLTQANNLTQVAGEAR